MRGKRSRGALASTLTGVTRSNRNALIASLAGGAAGAAIGSAVGESTLGAVVGAVVGVLVGFGLERALEACAELQELRALKSSFDQAEHDRAHERKLWEHRVRVAEAREQINALMAKVWEGMFDEVAAKNPGTGPSKTVAIARLHVEQQAAGLDKPIPPPAL